MERVIIPTKDGSHTVSIPGMQVTYHSIHGAVQESLHVFINAGLYELFTKNPGGSVRIFEMGLGTGLNALLTLIEAEKQQRPVLYYSAELFPLGMEEVRQLNYCTGLDGPDLQPIFEKLHAAEWSNDEAISEYFTLHKINGDLISLSVPQRAHLVYYDAFAPGAQPELWTQGVFEKLYAMLEPDGLLVTYCSKSDVRRAMQAAGFVVEKIPGPPGKREMLRATKSQGTNSRSQ